MAGTVLGLPTTFRAYLPVGDPGRVDRTTATLQDTLGDKLKPPTAAPTPSAVPSISTLGDYYAATFGAAANPTPGNPIVVPAPATSGGPVSLVPLALVGVLALGVFVYFKVRGQ